MLRGMKRGLHKYYFDQTRGEKTISLLLREVSMSCQTIVSLEAAGRLCELQ
jgi:hypothetical protein